MAKAFILNPEGKPEVNHIDGNRANNGVKNLEWVTGSENLKHGYRTGLIPVGSKRKLAKLTEAQVAEIKLLKGKESQESIAKRYGVSQSAIYFIFKGVTWSHVIAA